MHVKEAATLGMTGFSGTGGEAAGIRKNRIATKRERSKHYVSFFLFFSRLLAYSQ